MNRVYKLACNFNTVEISDITYDDLLFVAKEDEIIYDVEANERYICPDICEETLITRLLQREYDVIAEIKTANVIGAVIWQKEVMPVDTHVFRVAERIGLTTRSKTPLQTELTLSKQIPGHLLPVAHHWLILHGRYTCIARNPKCNKCGITAWCRHFEKEAIGR